MMKFVCVICVVVGLWASAVRADEVCNLRGIERMDSGFYWPIGKSRYTIGGDWLERDDEHGGGYVDDLYHIGIDMSADLHDPFYPISNGVIHMISNTSDSWGSGNCGVVVKHWTATGISFFALYAHGYLIPNSQGIFPKVGDRVWGGIPFMKAGHYSGGIHIHFGICPSSTFPSSSWGRLPNSSWPSTNSFVDPMQFLRDHQSDWASDFVEWQECVFEKSTLCSGIPEKKVLGAMIENPNINYVTKAMLYSLFDSLPDIVNVSDSGDEGKTYNGPDANVKYVEVSRDGVNWFRSSQVYPGEKLKVRVTVTNKGDETIDYFEVTVYRTRNETFNPDSDYKYGREEEEDDLKPGDSKRKHRDITVPTTPGTHRIYADINRVDGEYGGVDQDWNNNKSRNDDPEEYAAVEVGATSGGMNTLEPGVIISIINGFH